METAQALDALTFIPHKRPYLDQMSLPVAIQRAGMSWNILPERYNYSIGGILRGKKLAKDADVTLLHYRNRDVLGDAGRKKDLDKMLHDQLGTRLVSARIFSAASWCLGTQIRPSLRSDSLMRVSFDW